MKQIAIYCVNYQSYDSLHHYLASIDTAAEKARNNATVTVFVADNTVPASPIDYPAVHFTLQVMPTGSNKGYFGAIGYLMEHVTPKDYDYVIISNVDVLVDADFLTTLSTRPADDRVGWLAPQIYSRLEQRDRNPKIMHRYAKRKLQILRFLFSIPPLYNLYTHSAYKTKKLVHHEPGDIYAGHGSFIILTRSYFQQCGIISYPVFLFCEEIYLGEQCRQQQLRVVYAPTLKVTDAEHASTSTFRRSSYCRYNYQALSYILAKYY